MFKRLLSVVLSVTVLFTMIPAILTAAADGDPHDSNEVEITETPNIPNIPQLGESGNWMLWAVLLILSGGVIVLTAKCRKTAYN